MNGVIKGSRLSKHGAAIIFLICCILFSLLVPGGNKLKSLRNNVMGAYESGEESILGDLSKHNENAYNIITVGKRVLGSDNSAITDAETAYKNMNGASTPAEKYAADQQLDSAITYLVSALNDAGMNEKDKTLVAGQKSEMDSRDMIISHSDYNERVAGYSNTVSSFPANFIALCRGLGAPEYYR